ncbi:MAG TPA: PPC domain-containing protein [Pyrinomonadaceae bacterium]|nr:PPC domain-containing protein [Pyrinomonadaceae bacterium]
MSDLDDNADYVYPMRVQVAPGSEAEYRHYRNALRRSGERFRREALAAGVSASPQDDLIFRGGKTLPHMAFQNIYLGHPNDFAHGDFESIDNAITRLVRDERLQTIIQQYFPGKKLEYDIATSVMLDENRPNEMDEPDVQNKVIDLFDKKLIAATDLDRTIFNLVLPPDTVLKLNSSSSRNGLGGYHGSVHFSREGQTRTLYYSANVYSAVRSGQRNGIPFFSAPWKNVVCTLYHELMESQTDPDVGDAIRLNDRRFIGFNSKFGQEIGDQPIAANSLDKVFKEVLAMPGPTATPMQFMFSNKVHGAEGPEEKPADKIVVDGPEIKGEISSGGERDRYTFTVETAGTYTITTSGNTDTFVSLFGPNNESKLIAEDDDSGPGNLSLLSRNLTPGRYFVRVRLFSASSTGPYGISVRKGAA